MPGLALASLATHDQGRGELRVAASGLPPSADGSSAGTGAGAESGPLTMVTTVPDEVLPLVPTTAAAFAADPTPTATPSTTAEVHGRVAGINGSASPRPDPTDDPVVRPPATNSPAVASGGATAAGSSSGATTTTTAAAGPIPPCPTAEVSVTVAVDRPTYQPGEAVKGSTSIRNDSARTCLLAPRETVHVEDETGRVVSAFAYTMEYREPVVAAPGRTLGATFSWDQRDCSGSTCAQVRAGAYTVVAKWPLAGPTPAQSATYGPARAAFRIGG